MCKKVHFSNIARYSVANSKYVGSIANSSVIKCDEIINTIKSILIKTVPTKTVPTKINSKKVYILHVFLLVTIALLIAVNIFCYLMKYQIKEKHLLPHHVTTNELNEVLYK